MFPTRILLAADGSKDASLAARGAAELSQKLDSELHVVYVAPEHPYVYAARGVARRDEEDSLREEYRRTLDGCAEYVGEAGANVAESHLEAGDAAGEIVELAEELKVGLVVLGSRGRGRLRRALMGSVSTGVLRHAHCSVLIVRDHEDEREPILGKLLVAVDGSEEAAAAAQAATEMARAAGSEVHVAYAMQEERYRPHLGPEMWEGWEEDFERAKRSARSWVEGEAQRMKGEGAMKVEPHLLIGRSDAAIVWLAEEIGADLVLVGSRGLGAMKRTLLGGVSDSVVRHAHCPVMVVRGEPVDFPAKILLATDGSEEADLAASACADLAKTSGSELHVVCVQPASYVFEMADWEAARADFAQELERASERMAESTLEAQVQKIREAGGEVAEAHARVGFPDAEIVGLAGRLGIGLIVIGSRGRGPLRRALMGSVSDSVVRHAHCPVMVLRK